MKRLNLLIATLILAGLASCSLLSPESQNGLDNAALLALTASSDASTIVNGSGGTGTNTLAKGVCEIDGNTGYCGTGNSSVGDQPVVRIGTQNIAWQSFRTSGTPKYLPTGEEDSTGVTEELADATAYCESIGARVPTETEWVNALGQTGLAKSCVSPNENTNRYPTFEYKALRYVEYSDYVPRPAGTSYDHVNYIYNKTTSGVTWYWQLRRGCDIGESDNDPIIHVRCVYDL